MSNANTPALIAQSMAESLLRENRVLKEHNEHLLREAVKMAADVAAIQRAHDEQKLRLYTDIRSLKEQNAMLTVQVQEALTRMDRARYLLTDGNPTPNCNWGMLDTSDIKAALPQQVKSEDARDAEYWRFYRDNAMSWIDDMPLHEWIERNSLKLGGREAAIRAAISAQEPKG